MTTPGERRAKIDAGAKLVAPAGATVRTAAGVLARRRRLPDDDRPRRVPAHEPRRAAEAERCGGAEGGADERENGDAH